MFEKLTKTLDMYLDLGIPGYDCVVYHKGKCVYRHRNGYSDMNNKVPMNGSELYNIYSCSKVITCTAALMLYEKGFYKLEDPLSKYMPEFENMYVNTDKGIKKAENPITIKDLFCMTAGFSYDLNSRQIIKCKSDTDGVCATRELMRYLAKEPLLFEPGERWQYSLCHDVLAALVEVISGVRFGEFVRENIFVPLEMNNSTFLPSEGDIEKISSQYRYNSEINQTEMISKENGYRIGRNYESGGAGCVSCVDDYIRFLEGLRMGKLIGFDTIKLMTTNHLSDTQAVSYWLKDNYGYGLGVRCGKNEKEKKDFGWGGAAGSYLFIDMENEVSAFYAQHVLNSPVQNIRSEIKDIIVNTILENC